MVFVTLLEVNRHVRNMVSSYRLRGFAEERPGQRMVQGFPHNSCFIFLKIEKIEEQGPSRNQIIHDFHLAIVSLG